MAFDGLSFMTGNYALDTFLPPGKIADYFSFQYMRDVTADGMGHNTNFLTRIAGNVWSLLLERQKRILITLGRSEYSPSVKFAKMRLPIMQAFRDSMNAKARSGHTSVLNTTAVLELSQSLYEIDGSSSYSKASAKATIINSLTTAQQKALQDLGFAAYSTWPDTTATAAAVEDVKNRLKTAANGGDIAANVLGYTSELFSWYLGNVEKDAYFCPERHAMYFGGFGYKTLPGKGMPNYSISTGFTADGGTAFMDLLTSSQRDILTQTLTAQQLPLMSIVTTRTATSTELRKLLSGGTASKALVISLSRDYGRYDGTISCLYADAFANIFQSMTQEQKGKLASWRDLSELAFQGPFLYANVDPTMVPSETEVAKLFNKIK